MVDLAKQNLTVYC